MFHKIMRLLYHIPQHTLKGILSPFKGDNNYEADDGFFSKIYFCDQDIINNNFTQKSRIIFFQS